MKAKAPLRSRSNLTKERYLERLHELAKDYYSLGRGKSWAKSKAESHLNGYLLAGTHTRLANAEELSSILEELHYDEFGYSIEDGKALTKLGAIETEDWSKYAEPTFLRYGRGIAIKRRWPRGSNRD